MNSYWQQLRKAWTSQQVIWIITALIVAVLIWANYARLDVVVVGQGRLVPSASVQKVQSLDGGILRELHVQQGDTVTVGQLLVTLDETRARSSVAEVRAEQRALDSRRSRLQAEMRATVDNQLRVSVSPFSGSDILPREVERYRAEMDELRRRLEKADEDILQQRQEVAEARQNLQTMRESLSLLDNEISLTAEAVDAGALSAAELRKLERERLKIAGQIEAESIQLSRLQSMVVETQQSKSLIIEEFRSQAQSELSEVESRLERIGETLTGLESQLDQTRLTASMAGVVKAIGVPSIGGVVKPGEMILEIVPAGGSLLVEARILPRDIARLEVGQTAVVKFSAYDFVIFGGLRGELVHVSPDAVVDDQQGPYFVVHIASESGDWQQGGWEDRTMIPGMQAEVDILTGTKTVLEYWLKPLLRARANSMREP